MGLLRQLLPCHHQPIRRFQDHPPRVLDLAHHRPNLRERERERAGVYLYGEGEIVRELEMRGKGEGGGKWFTKMKSEDHFMLHITI
jgi:hypothetical protein